MAALNGSARPSTGNGLPNVVVTGYAMTTALATDANGTWKRLLDGESGIRTLDDYFVELYDLPVRIGGHLLEDFESELTPDEQSRWSYLQKMATVVGRRAWEHAGSPDVDSRRLMVSIGTGMGSSEELLYAYDGMREKGAAAVSPLAVQTYMPNSPAAAVGLERGAKAGVVTPVSACASGSEAIANAWRNIVLGEADVAICGGVETRIEAVPIAGFAQMRIVLSTTNDDPAGACRPFDKDRNGFVFGEGARADGPRDRGARQGARRQHPRPADGRRRHLGRLPHRGARPDRRSGRATRSRARSSWPACRPSDIDHVNAHATGTSVGDVAEGKAINNALGSTPACGVRTRSRRSGTPSAPSARWSPS